MHVPTHGSGISAAVQWFVRLLRMLNPSGLNAEREREREELSRNLNRPSSVLGQNDLRVSPARGVNIASAADSRARWQEVCRSRLSFECGGRPTAILQLTLYFRNG